MCSISGGGTLAYFNSRHTNVTSLSTDIYQTSVTDTFTSPENWLPGTTVEHEMKLTNTGDVKVAVRAKIEQHWISANGDELNGFFTNGHTCASTVLINGIGGSRDADMVNSCNELNNNTYPQLSFDYWSYNRLEWNSSKYYYYNFFVDSGKSTSSLISEIIFDEDVPSDYQCETVGSEERCISTGNGYDGATYTLTVTFETVQYDKYQEYWNTNIEIVDEPYHTTIESNLVDLNSVTAGTINVNPISITNTSDKKVVIRAKLQETVDGEKLINYINAHENYYANIAYSEVTPGNNYWYKDDGYLYYYKKLDPNEAITHLIDSITFNDSENKTYKLDVTYEMVDAEQYNTYFIMRTAQRIRFDGSDAVYYTNSTNENVALRAKVTGKWYDLNDNEISNVSFIDYKISNSNNNWVKNNNYYYYNTHMSPNESLPTRMRLGSNVVFDCDYSFPIINSNNNLEYTITFDTLPNVKYVAELEFEATPYETYTTDWNTDVVIN